MLAQAEHSEAESGPHVIAIARRRVCVSSLALLRSAEPRGKQVSIQFTMHYVIQSKSRPQGKLPPLWRAGASLLEQLRQGTMWPMLLLNRWNVWWPSQSLKEGLCVTPHPPPLASADTRSASVNLSLGAGPARGKGTMRRCQTLLLSLLPLHQHLPMPATVKHSGAAIPMLAFLQA
jgi:hypothetical protein